jgi:hypothetical protein
MAELRLPVEFSTDPIRRVRTADIIGFDKLVNELVGQVDRVERYPELGFTEKTKVPEEVIAAKRQLVQLGFANHLISEVAH